MHKPDFLWSERDGVTFCNRRSYSSPSGVDAYAWCHFCSSFRLLYRSMQCYSCSCKEICTVNVHPDGIAAFVACHLIRLNKNPGVRPIGIGEVPRWIVVKVVLKIVRGDVQTAAGFCKAGCEVAVHAMRGTSPRRSWVSEIDSLAAVACPYPHAAYTAWGHWKMGISDENCRC